MPFNAPSAARMPAVDFACGPKPAERSSVVGLMDRQGTPGVKFDVEGSGYGFRVVKTIAAGRAEMPTSCKMNRPS